MNNRIILKYHSWFGLIVGSFLIVMGISGSILIFHEQLDDQIFSDFKQEFYPGNPQIDSATFQVQKKYPGWDTRISEFNENELIIFDVRREQKRRYIFAEPETGNILKDLNANSHFTSWLLKLHYSLQAGVAGRIIIFFVGLLFFLSLITGTILYRRSIFKTLTFQAKLKTTRKRIFYSSLHRYVGTWALIFNFVIVITGIVLAYGVAKAGLNPRSEYHSPIINTSIETSLTRIKKEFPQFHPTYIRLPLENEAGITFYGHFEKDFFLFSEFYNRIRINEKTGDFISVERIAESNIWTKINATITPLHYAEFGGLPIKILYSLIGLTGPFLSISGFILYVMGKRKKRTVKKTSKTI